MRGMSGTRLRETADAVGVDEITLAAYGSYRNRHGATARRTTEVAVRLGEKTTLVAAEVKDISAEALMGSMFTTHGSEICVVDAERFVRVSCEVKPNSRSKESGRSVLALLCEIMYADSTNFQPRKEEKVVLGNARERERNVNTILPAQRKLLTKKREARRVTITKERQANRIAAQEICGMYM